MSTTGDNTLFLDASNPGIVGLGLGNDRYVLSGSSLRAGQQITINDADGANILQLVGGLAIASSQVSNNAIQLTLTNGAIVNVLGASTFTFLTGGDAFTGTGGLSQTFSQFVTVALGSTVPAAGAAPVPVGPVTLVNPSVPVLPTFSVAGPADVAEGASATFTVTLSAAQSSATTVSYALAGTGGAILGTDTGVNVPAGNTGTLTFAAGEVSKTVVVPITADTISPEAGEGVSITLSAPSTGTAVSTTAGTVTTAITDVPVSYTLTASAANVFEGVAITYTLTASAASTTATSVDFSVVPGDPAAANAGTNNTNLADFAQGAFNPTTIVMAAGATTATYTVTSLADTITELPENYSVKAVIGGTTVATKTTSLLDGGGTGPGAVGTTFTLTTNLDAPGATSPSVNTQGTGGNDIYKGVIDDSTPANTTLQATDDIDGAGGIDTLQIISNGNNINTVTPLFLKNVEKVSVKDVHAANGTTVNLVNATGVTEVINDGSVGAVAFQNIGAAAAVTVQNVKTAAATTTFTRGTSAVTDALTLNLSNLGTVDVPGLGAVAAGAVSSLDTNNLATSVTINATGTVSVASAEVTGSGGAGHTATSLTINAAGATNFGAGITGFDTTKADKIVVTGAGSVNLGAALAGAVQTVDASANTGGVTLVGTQYGGTDATAAAAPGLKITAGSGKDNITVTGVASAVVAAGAGDDTVNVSAGLVAGAKIDGGEGTDRIVVTAAQANALDNQDVAGTALRATLTGFEQLSISGALDVANNFNINQAGGYNYLVVGGDVTGSATVTGFTSGATVEFTNLGTQTTALEIGVTDAALTSTDVLNLKLNANLAGSVGSEAIYKAGITGINTVNVVANDARDNIVDNNNPAATADNGPDDGYTLALSNSANLTNLNISGSSLVSYTLTTGTNALKLVDASASTGNAVIDVTAFAGTERVTVNGSQGQNTLTGSNTAFGDALNGGAKNDSITGKQGADALKGNGGRDVFNFAGGDSLAVTGGFDKIADFGKVTVAGVANTTATFQNVGAVGGADADLLNVVDTGLALAAAKAITALDATALGLITAVTGSDVLVTDDIKIAVNAKGVVTLSGANAAKVDTLAEWVAVAQEAAGVVAGAVTAFEFNGNTYVFQEVSSTAATATDTLIELTGVTGFGATNGIVLAGSNAAVGDIFVG